MKKTKVISFKNRTWEQICAAVLALKNRYRKVLKLIAQYRTYGSMYRGYIEVA